MRRVTLILILTLCLATTANAGERSRQRFIARAATVIQQTPLPADATGAAFTRTLRFNWIPFSPPFGGYLFGGRSAAFRLDHGQLTEPRLTRHAGAGLTATLGVGLPFSASLSSDVRAFTGSEYDRFSSGSFPQASVKAYAGVGLPGRSFVKSVGPVFGEAPPGRVVHRREFHVGLWAAVGAAVEVRSQWPVRGRR